MRRVVRDNDEFSVVKVCDYMSIFNTPENKEKIEKANADLKKKK